MSTVATFSLDINKARQILDRKIIEPRLRKAAEIVKSNVRSLMPVDSGVMKQNLETRMEYPKIYIGFFEDTWSAEAPYYYYVEFGTGQFAEKGNGRKTPWVYFSKRLNRFVYTTGMKAQPSLRPGLFISRNEILKIFKEGTFNAEKGTVSQIL